MAIVVVQSKEQIKALRAQKVAAQVSRLFSHHREVLCCAVVLRVPSQPLRFSHVSRLLLLLLLAPHRL